MKEHDSRTGFRLPTKQRQRIEQLITAGQFKNISQVVRATLNEFLKREGDWLT